MFEGTAPTAKSDMNVLVIQQQAEPTLQPSREPPKFFLSPFRNRTNELLLEFLLPTTVFPMNTQIPLMP